MPSTPAYTVVVVVLILLIVFNVQSKDAGAIRPSTSGFCNDVTLADECVSLLRTNCTVEEMSRWNAESLPTCLVPSCRLYLHGFEHSPFPDKKFPRPALNITFQKVIHNPVWFMYEEATKTNDSQCYTVSVSTSPLCNNSVSHLYFDCHVKNSSGYSLMIPNSITTVRAIVDGHKSLYKFRNLYVYDLSEEKKIFFYVRDELGPPVVTFQASKRITSYLIHLCRYPGDDCRDRRLVDISNSSTYNERYGDLYSVTLGETKLRNGSYQISVIGYCDNGTVNLFNCTSINSYDFDVIETCYYTAEVVGGVFLLIFLTAFVTGVIIYRARRAALRPIPNAYKMLLAYDGVSIDHADEVLASRFFLRDWLGVEVLLDVTDIPEHSSPYEWYSRAVLEVDTVVIIVPPNVPPGTTRGCRFRKTYQLCLAMLESRWGAKLQAKNRSSCSVLSTADIVLFLPSSADAQVPPVVSKAPKFRLPDQYCNMRQHIVRLASPSSISAGCFTFPLPSVLLSKTESVVESFGRHVDKVRERREHRAATFSAEEKDETYSLLQHSDEEDEKLTLERKTNLDAIFGDQILSVRDLPPVSGLV